MTGWTAFPAAPASTAWTAIGIKAIVSCPLVKQGRLVVIMAVHQSSPRDWAQREISLVETVVDRAFAHIERVRAEPALRESEERLRLIVEGARDYAIFTADPVCRIGAWLAGAANVCGWSAPEQNSITGDGAWLRLDHASGGLFGDAASRTVR